MDLITFSTILSVFFLVFEAAFVIGWLLYFISPKFKKWSLSLLSQRSWIVASMLLLLASLVGSLTFSLFYVLPVCELCYYQRMFMYPQIVLLAVGLYKKDYDVMITVSLILSAIGAFFSIYQYYYQIVNLFTVKEMFLPCNIGGTGPSCTEIPFMTFGHITIPFMAFVTFLLIMSAMYLARRSTRK